ncbi:dehydrogenase [Fischerella thermalis CCMEE 5330]|uniref:Dehydrogenase n=1 Tax=Fischerella thermalis CCMEE 5330 TaxID=2019670 RepID=A0A2N6M598_9CYAN|nr:alcohol dehydrogenase catalytic domain-containing protein [Fischerella thermalis]PMB41975.1 dehydrogenase [Fischerella thermalis CCMEE 5330]
MLAALLYGKENLRLETVADPTPKKGEVVIQVGAATTCGTDLKVWRRGGHAKMLKPPTLFGHEAAGQIVAIGEGVTGWQIGDRVVANNSAPCMNCFFCQRQEYSLCPNLTWNNGTFAEYLKIPAPIVEHNLLPIPEDLPYELAAMTEPLACVLHGAARSNVKLGDRVVVLGDGAIGLMFVAKLTHDLGAEVLLFGGNDDRLEIGQKLGAAQTFNYRQLPDIPTLVKEFTDGWGADVVIEATGLPSVWETAIACARPGATVNLFGGCPRDTTITVNTEQLHYSELTLKGVFHNTPEFVRAALSLIASRTIPFELLISEQRPLQDLEAVFCDMRSRKVIKVAMIP